MTEPIRYVAFVQKVADNWRQFRVRDDVDEDRGYWAIRSDGNAEWVSAWDSTSLGDPRRSRFNDDENRSGMPRQGLFGTPLFKSQMQGNPLRGRPGNGKDVDPEASSAVRRWLAGRGYDGPAITMETAFDIAEQVQKTEAGIIQDEDPAAELLREIVSKMGDQEGLNQFRKLFRDAGKAEKVLMKVAGAQAPNASGRSPEDLAAESQRDPSFSPDPRGVGVSSSLGARVLGEDRARALASGQPDPGTTASKGGISQTAGNVAGGGKAATTAVPSTPGKGPGGQDVTPELLKEYLESNWRVVFNAHVNKFRDAGAATMFLDWLMNQATRYLAEFEGTLGEQAAAGQVPSGSFVDFMQQKTGQTIGIDPQAGTGQAQNFSGWLGAKNKATTKAAPAGQPARTASGYTPPEPIDEAMQIAFGPPRPSGV